MARQRELAGHGRYRFSRRRSVICPGHLSKHATMSARAFFAGVSSITSARPIVSHGARVPAATEAYRVVRRLLNWGHDISDDMADAACDLEVIESAKLYEGKSPLAHKEANRMVR